MVPDVSPPPFIVTNLTAQPILVGPLTPDPNEPSRLVDPGRGVGFYPGFDVCESMAYVATSTSGEVLAEIPSGCRGHEWMIYGPNNATYTKS